MAPPSLRPFSPPVAKSIPTAGFCCIEICTKQLFIVKLPTAGKSYLFISHNPSKFLPVSAWSHERPAGHPRRKERVLRGKSALPSQSQKGDLECFVLRSEKETCFFRGLDERLRADQYYKYPLVRRMSPAGAAEGRGQAHHVDVRALLSSAQWHV